MDFRRVRFALCRADVQLSLIVALADRHAPRAQDVVGGDGVEMEVGQREREDEVLRREGEPPRADLEIELLARAAVDLVLRGGDEVQGAIVQEENPALALRRSGCDSM